MEDRRSGSSEIAGLFGSAPVLLFLRNMNFESSSPTPIRPKPPFRVGLIGVTGYAHAYFDCLNALASQGRVTLSAVTIINPQDAAEQIGKLDELGVPVYEDYRAMLEAEKLNLDWVCIPTGIGFHKQMTIDCLRLGLQVLVEKPLAPTLQDVEAIQAVERETGIAVGVGFQHSYLEQTWEIKRRLLGGEIGDLQRVDCIGLWPRSRNYYARNEWSGQLHDGESWVLDSPLHNGLSHMANLILFWLGDRMEDRAELTRVSAELYRCKPIESFDTVRTVAHMENGLEAAVILSHGCMHRVDPEIVVTGTKGTFHWRFCGTHTFRSGSDYSVMKSPGQLEIRDLMFDAITDHVGGNTTRLCSTEQAKGTCKWVNAVHDICPIQDIGPEFRLSVEDESSDVFDAIEDVEYFAMRAFRERKSFCEVGAPWAIDPREQDTSEYTYFEGRHCGAPVESRAASSATS